MPFQRFRFRVAAFIIRARILINNIPVSNIPARLLRQLRLPLAEAPRLLRLQLQALQDRLRPGANRITPTIFKELQSRLKSPAEALVVSAKEL